MILLDTHVLVWWVSSPEKLSQKAKKAIKAETKPGNILVSAISFWEIAMLVKKKRLELTIPTITWIEKTLSLPQIEPVSLDWEVLVDSTELKGYSGKDPADRMIIATAIQIGVPLVTADDKIHGCALVTTVW